MLQPSPRTAWSGSDLVAIRPRSRGRETALITPSGNPDELSWLRINHLARTRCRIEDYELVSANLSPGIDPRRVAANPYYIRWRDDAGTGEELGVREDDAVGPFHGQDVHPLGWPGSLKVPHELIGPLPHKLGHVATSGPDEILDGGELGLRPSQVREHLQHVVEADLGHGAKVRGADGHRCDELDLLGRELGNGPVGRDRVSQAPQKIAHPGDLLGHREGPNRLSPTQAPVPQQLCQGFGIVTHSVMDWHRTRLRQKLMLKHNLPEWIDVLRAGVHLPEQVGETGCAPR